MKDAIERDGFPSGPGVPGDRHLLLGHPPATREHTVFACDHGWLVVAEVPDDVASGYRRRDDPDADLYDMPATVLNGYAPFGFVRV